MATRQTQFNKDWVAFLDKQKKESALSAKAKEAEQGKLSQLLSQAKQKKRALEEELKHQTAEIDNLLQKSQEILKLPCIIKYLDSQLSN